MISILHSLFFIMFFYHFSMASMAGLLLFLGDASKATLAHSQALAGNGFVFSGKNIEK